MNEDRYTSTLMGLGGPWKLVTTDEYLIEISFLSTQNTTETSEYQALNQEACRQLSAYFEGNLSKFDLPIDLTMGTSFMQQVWKEVANIPYGETCSYKDIAQILGDINAVRAIGTANGRNPVPIVIPCHRVIGENGALTGYAYGLDLKKELLRHEMTHRKVPQHLLF